MTEERLNLVKPVLDTFANDDIKEFAVILLDGLPEYIWHVGASSTGKYHPAYSLGEGGLMRHQMAVVRFLNFFFDLEQYNSKLTSREMDLMRVAGLVHDGRKSGSQEDYEKSKYTKFDHPMQMADVVRSYDGQYLNHEEIEMIADAISKHMGQWNTDKKSDLVLLKPSDKFSRMIHVADYLASRKCLTIDFDNYEAPKVDIPDLNTFVMPFGNKHKGELLVDIAKNDPSYITWMRENIRREPFISLIKELDQRNKEENI
jgi:FtsZ-interacting cell division protein YlmF